MSLSSDSAVLTMPVQPANTNGGNGFGFGNDGAWWIIILFLFAFCGGSGSVQQCLYGGFRGSPPWMLRYCVAQKH